MNPEVLLSSMDGIAAGNDGTNNTAHSISVRINTLESHRHHQPHNDLTASNLHIAASTMETTAAQHNSCSSPSSQYAPSSLSLESFDDESRLARAIAAATASAQELVVTVPVVEQAPPTAQLPTVVAAVEPTSSSTAAANVVPRTTTPTTTTINTSPNSGSGTTTAVEVACCCGVMGQRPTLSTTIGNTMAANDDDHDVWKTSSPNNHASAAAGAGHGPTDLAIGTAHTEEEDDDDLDNVNALRTGEDNGYSDPQPRMLDNNAATPKRGNQSQGVQTSSGQAKEHPSSTSSSVFVSRTTTVPPPPPAVVESHGNVDPQTLISMLTASFEEDTSPGGVELVMNISTTAAAAPAPLPKATTDATLAVVDTVPPPPALPPLSTSLPASSCASSITGPLEYCTPLDDDDAPLSPPLDVSDAPLNDTTTTLDTLGAPMITDESTTSRSTEPITDIADSSANLPSSTVAGGGGASTFLAATLSTIEEGVGSSDTMGPSILATSTTASSGGGGSAVDFAASTTTLPSTVVSTAGRETDPAVETESPVPSTNDAHAPLAIQTTRPTLENPEELDVSDSPMASGVAVNVPAAVTLESTISSAEPLVPEGPHTTSDATTESHLEASIEVTNALSSLQASACTEGSGTVESKDEPEQTSVDGARSLNDPSAPVDLPTNDKTIDELVYSNEAGDHAKATEQASLELTTVDRGEFEPLEGPNGAADETPQLGPPNDMKAKASRALQIDLESGEVGNDDTATSTEIQDAQGDAGVTISPKEEHSVTDQAIAPSEADLGPHIEQNVDTRNVVAVAESTEDCRATPEMPSDVDLTKAVTGLNCTVPTPALADQGFQGNSENVEVDDAAISEADCSLPEFASTTKETSIPDNPVHNVSEATFASVDVAVANEEGFQVQNATSVVSASISNIDSHVVSPSPEQNLGLFEAVPSDECSQLSQSEASERLYGRALSSPVQGSDSSSVKLEPGTVAPYADFIAHQSNQRRESKEKERQARRALNSPEKAKPRPLSIDVGIVTPYSDFVSHQSAQIKANKEKERAARQALANPAQAERGTKDIDGTGIVAPFMDFAAQQSAQIKANKQKEREARQALSSPAQAEMKSKVDLSPGAGVIAPFTDFTAHQSAQIKTNKAKEREARKALSSPARASPKMSVGSDTSAPFTDFAMQQSAQIKAAKEREREARQDMNRPIQGSSLDQHAAELRAMNLHQKQKFKEAQESLSTYKSTDGGAPGDIQSSMAADLKRQQEAQKQKKKEAEEMAASYRHVDPSLGDAQSRLAAALKQQDIEEKRKKREAEQHVTMYRPSDLESIDAATRTANQIRSLKKEQTRKKKEAEELISAYRSVPAGGDAASQVSASISVLKEEQRLKKKEAEQLVQGYRTVGLESGNAPERLAAELKRQQEIERQKYREAQALITGYRNNDRGTQQQNAGSTEAQPCLETVDNVPVSTPRSLDDLRTRTDEELKTMSELRRQQNADGNDEEPSSNIDSFRSKVSAELASLQSNGSSFKSLSDEFNRGVSGNAESVSALAQEELIVLQQSGINLRSLADEFDRGMLSSVVDKVKLQTQQELSSLQPNLSATRENFDRGIHTNGLEKLRAAKESELAGIQGSNAARKLAETFDRGIQSDNIERVKLKTEQELQSLQSKGPNAELGYSTREMLDGNLSSIKARTAQELAGLQGVKSNAMDALSPRAREADVADSTKTRTTAEIASLQTNGTSARDLADQFSQTANKSVEKSQAQIDELAALTGNKGGMKKLAEKFNMSPSTSTGAKGGSKSANELQNLKGTGSIKDRMQTFNQGLKNSKVDELKTQAAQELRLVQQGQIRKKKELEEAAASSAASETATESKTATFTEAELAAFEHEKNLRQQELDQLKEFESNKKLEALRSRAAAELQAIAQGRKMSSNER
jgi:hypothetical protein